MIIDLNYHSEVTFPNKIIFIRFPMNDHSFRNGPVNLKDERYLLYLSMIMLFHIFRASIAFAYYKIRSSPHLLVYVVQNRQDIQGITGLIKYMTVKDRRTNLLLRRRRMNPGTFLRINYYSQIWCQLLASVQSYTLRTCRSRNF